VWSLSHRGESLVHICTLTDWLAARRAGEHRPPSLYSEGFVHLSAARQVHIPANLLFGGRTDLVLLRLDGARLGSPVKWEPGTPPGPHDMDFPPLYGPLPAAAVTAVVPYEPDTDGRFAPFHR